jgi:hypothetical protein
MVGLLRERERAQKGRRHRRDVTYAFAGCYRPTARRTMKNQAHDGANRRTSVGGP